ncbi:hypothetical protein GF108_03180 [Phyllobacterium sp. SYP-B3895]|uniref:hypothetical protein n=1 Tax=Phyllobacterium sp. SYP-B3895 TaxID=2663240 RepID=UPI001299E167|nr:hypothetical protein [Phyllobacterium sp. SYP-B3895]MRG54586.1 hypothetical protein [Phyllobacterium sp. SYP-B3895]
MSLDGLKLSAARQKPQLDSWALRRKRLVKQIDKQIAFVEQTAQGRNPRGRWWWVDEDGKLVLSIKYGRNALELAKGKQAIICDTLADVVVALDKTRAAAVGGTFDPQLEAISVQIKKRFQKK